MIDAMVGVTVTPPTSIGLGSVPLLPPCVQGVARCEGVFRKSCEVTMRVLREQCDPLVWYV